MMALLVCLMNMDLRAAVLLLWTPPGLMVALPMTWLLPTTELCCYALLLLLSTSVLFEQRPSEVLA